MEITKLGNVVEMPIDSIIPYDRNPRLNDDAVETVAQSIAEFGWEQPIVVDSSNVIIVGHTRRLAAMRLGLKTVPVVVASHLTPDQVKAYRLADNKTGEKSTWDFAFLKDEISDLNESGYDLASTGFGKDEIDRILSDGGEEEDAEENPSDEAPEDAPDADDTCDGASVPGGIYRLGKHLLLCGDATDSEALGAFLSGVDVKMVYTDLPYGMNLDTDFSSMKSCIQGLDGKKFDSGKVDEFHPEMVDAALRVKADDHFLWGADYFAELLPSRNEGSWIVWDKRSDEGDTVEQAESSGKMYGSEFELCWSRKRHKRSIARVKWAGVFGIHEDGEGGHRVHPTQKPILLARWFIERFTKDGDVVADMFGGSGSTLMACEMTNRVCYMSEIDPHYCNVIRKRWAEYVHGRGCDWTSMTEKCN